MEDHLAINVSPLQKRQERCKEFYGAVNSVVAQLGGVSRNDKIWTK